MTQTLLSVKHLKTCFYSEQDPISVVDGVSFDIQAGKTFALLGESGCGKSMTALSLMRLNPEHSSKISGGDVTLNGNSLFALTEQEMQSIRGQKIAMIFQEPQSSLNPVMTIGQQITECLQRYFSLTPDQCQQRVIELLASVGIADPVRCSQDYPHQLSGGMKQRIMIAMALSGQPDLLIADEPTTALDVTTQAQILALLKQLQRDTGMAILLISHDLALVADMADDIAIMYAGQIVEKASRNDLFASPKHPYTQKLFEAIPHSHKREQLLSVIKGTVPSLATAFTGCRFAKRCEQAIDVCHHSIPDWSRANDHDVLCHLYADDSLDATAFTPISPAHLSDVIPAEKALLKVNDLKVHFPIRKGLFKRQVGSVSAVDGVSLNLSRSETVAIVGESGCGKTTLAKGILQLVPVTSGDINFRGDALVGLSQRQLKSHRSAMQIIFQDPFSSMNPRMTVAQIIEEGMQAKDKETRSQRVDYLLKRVGLQAEHKHRYPHAFSGGQRQRICIARALATDPEVIICDEPTSALDVSVQAQILNLLREIQHEFGLSFLFITHNIAVVDYLAHRVVVMYLGRIVEQGSREQVLNTPLHPYTKALLSAVPKIDANSEQTIIKLEGELPSPATPPQGCHFHQRCPNVMEKCRHSYPATIRNDSGQQVNCFLYEEEPHGQANTN